MHELLKGTEVLLGADGYNLRPDVMMTGVPTVDGGSVPVAQLWRRFADSPYGRHMDEQQPYRWSAIYGYQRDLMHHDLGADVVPTPHMLEAAQYTAWVIAEEQLAGTASTLPERDIPATLFAVGIHDMGEPTHPQVEQVVGATVGDIPFGAKTDADRAVETGVRNFMFEKVFPDIHPDVIERAELIISHKDQTMAHEMFEAAHDVQGYITGFVRSRLTLEAMRAAGVDMSGQSLPDYQQERIASLQRMHSDVTHNLNARLRRHEKQFIAVQKAMRAANMAVANATAYADSRTRRILPRAA